MITLRFPNTKELQVNLYTLALLYVQAYDAVIVDQNGQLSLDFSA
jgi:hypothetical protein